jgi:hypothetical protein
LKTRIAQTIRQLHHLIIFRTSTLAAQLALDTDLLQQIDHPIAHSLSFSQTSTAYSRSAPVLPVHDVLPDASNVAIDATEQLPEFPPRCH